MVLFLSWIRIYYSLHSHLGNSFEKQLLAAVDNYIPVNKVVQGIEENI